MYQITINENKYEVKPNSQAKNKGELNGQNYAMDVEGNSEKGFSIISDSKSYEAYVLEADHASKTFKIAINNNVFDIVAEDKYDLLLKELGMATSNASMMNELKAPMPGLVLKINVAEGDVIEKDQPLLVLEAMKMENVLKAIGPAKIKSINCQVGAAVGKNDVLIEFEAS